MAVHGPYREHERFGDQPVGHPSGRKPGDLQLPIGQRRRSAAWAQPGFCPSKHAGRTGGGWRLPALAAPTTPGPIHGEFGQFTAGRAGPKRAASARYHRAVWIASASTACSAALIARAPATGFGRSVLLRFLWKGGTTRC